jgi:probable HAF family extracellular repeat protein
VGEAENEYDGIDPFLHNPGSGAKYLGTVGGTTGYAYGVNKSGEVVGYSETAAAAGGFSNAFLYTAAGGLTDLGTLGGPASSAQAINDAGEVVGISDTSAGLYSWHAFLYSDGGMIDLGTLGGSTSYAIGINNSGQIVGEAELAGNTSFHAFLYSGGKMIDLGTLGGPVSYGNGINNAGQIVGSSTTLANPGGTPGDPDGDAFLYSDGTMVDLNSLLPAGSGWDLQSANAIDDSGQIVGLGEINGQYHAYLLDTEAPATAPEPSMYGVLAIGMFGMFLAARRLKPSGKTRKLRRRSGKSARA